MGRIDIRNVPEDVLLKLSNRAKKLGMSREAYVRDILTYAANEDLIEETEERYKTLVRDVLTTIKEQGDVIERNTLLLSVIFDKLG